MKSAWKKWSIVGVSIATISVAGILYATLTPQENVASIPTPTAPNSAPTAVLASVWDRDIQPYTGTSEVTVYRSPSCGCCGEWVEHIERHGFRVKDIQTDDMEAIKAEQGLPTDLASCHTAIIDGYVLEGHIPARDIIALLNEKPDIAGIAVPGMPLGSPGMEAGDRKQDFAVLSFDDAGEIEVFQEHQGY